MVTVKSIKERMEADKENAILYLMGFVDDFRYHKSPEALAVPFESGDERLDALLASTVERLCHELDITPPAWVEKVPSCREPWFVSGVENLKAMDLAQSPLEFKIRKIFVLENFLDRR